MRKILVLLVLLLIAGGVCLGQDEEDVAYLKKKKRTFISLAAASPTLVQWASGSSTNTTGVSGGGSVTAYEFYLPNNTQAGNAIVGCVTLGSTTATMTVTDDQSNSYTVIATGTDSTNVARVYAFRALNVAAGTRKLTFTPSASNPQLAPTVAEFYNVAQSSADDGNATGNSASGSSTMATGSITPGTSGDLLFQCGYRSQTRFVNAATPYTAGSQSNITWNLLATDAMDGLVSQYGVYTSTSAISPQLTMGNNSGYVTAAIALKAALAGNPRPSGMQIVGIEHVSINSDHAATTPLLLQFSTIGNLIAAGSVLGNSITYAISSITDGNSNTWVSTSADVVFNDRSIVWYTANATPSTSLTISLNTVNSTGNNGTVLLYDIVNAAASPFVGVVTNSNNTTIGGNGTQACCTTTFYTTVVPGSTDGIAIGVSGEQQNTARTTSAPSASGVMDSAFANGLSLSGPEPVDQNNFFGHFKYTANSTQTWTIGYTQNGSLATGNWTAKAAFFKSATGSGIPYMIQAGNNRSAASATTVAVTLGAGTGSGNLLAAIGQCGSSHTVSSISDGTNTFATIAGSAGTQGTNEIEAQFLSSSTSGKTIITLTCSGAAGTFNKELWVWEIGGLTSNAVDQAGNVTNGTAVTNVVSGPALTTSQTQGFGVCGAAVANAVNQPPQGGNAGNAWTQNGGIMPGSTNGYAALVFTATGTYTCKFHDASASDPFAATAVTFK